MMTVSDLSAGLAVIAAGRSQWKRQDWAFWMWQSLPQAFNFAYQFRSDGTNKKQAERDVFFGVIVLLFSSVYPHDWPSGYRDAPRPPGWYSAPTSSAAHPGPASSSFSLAASTR
jgi:hypothetical protein